jgi:hypothetical protein
MRLPSLGSLILAYKMNFLTLVAAWPLSYMTQLGRPEGTGGGSFVLGGEKWTQRSGGRQRGACGLTGTQGGQSELRGTEGTRERKQWDKGHREGSRGHW